MGPPGPLYLVVRNSRDGSYSVPEKIVAKVGKAVLATNDKGTLYLVYDDGKGRLYT
jgi:hypothetical protein